MNIQFYWEKLRDMKTFKEFLKSNKEAYLCSGFFIIDKKGNDNKQHFDFYLPKEKKIIGFEMENQGQKVPIELVDEKIPRRLELKKDEDFNFEFDEIEELIEEALRENGVKSKIEKIMVSLQSRDGEKGVFLICTVFLSGLGMANVTISADDKKVVSFQKKSLFNMMRRVK